MTYKSWLFTVAVATVFAAPITAISQDAPKAARIVYLGVAETSPNTHGRVKDAPVVLFRIENTSGAEIGFMVWERGSKLSSLVHQEIKDGGWKTIVGWSFCNNGEKAMRLAPNESLTWAESPDEYTKNEPGKRFRFGAMIGVADPTQPKYQFIWSDPVELPIFAPSPPTVEPERPESISRSQTPHLPTRNDGNRRLRWCRRR